MDGDCWFTAGKTLIQQKNTADSVLRPQRGGVRPGVTEDLQEFREIQVIQLAVKTPVSFAGDLDAPTSSWACRKIEREHFALRT
jgi:hypothetical protein